MGTHIDEVRVKGVNIVEAREIGEDLCELLVVVHVRVLDLAHIKLRAGDSVGVAGPTGMGEAQSPTCRAHSRPPHTCRMRTML